MKKPTLPDKKKFPINEDVHPNTSINSIVWRINQLIDYIKHLEERIFDLEKGDNR
jgi:hypothetical protein